MPQGGGSSGGSSAFLTTSVNLTSSDVRALYTTPIVIVAGVPDKLITLLSIRLDVFQGDEVFFTQAAYLLITDESGGIWTPYSQPAGAILDAGPSQLLALTLGLQPPIVPATALNGLGYIMFLGDPPADQGNGRASVTTLYALTDAAT